MEKGGYIKRISSVEGVKGALIIQLPSKFTGGALTIYHSEENGEEESFKFSMGAGVDAMFSCHFACHFSDCDYEMAKIKSGSRTYLSYSLHYKQVDQLPTASMVYGSRSLKKSLTGLPPADRLVVLPLHQNYEAFRLQHFGINALSHEHRKKAEALKAAGTKWEFVIVNAMREITFSRYDCSRSNRTSILDIYDNKGSHVTDELSWLERSIDLNSIEKDGGMLLAFDDNTGPCLTSARSLKHLKAIMVIIQTQHELI